MTSLQKLTLKLLVDKEKKRVVFAESDKDFVDILFSFLTLPLGAVIRILDKQSFLGRMDKLYESIENLHEHCFNTEACKTMLLNPLNACGEPCEDLVLRVDDSNPRIYYTCRKKECSTKSFPFFSSVPKTRCGCGQIMDFERELEKEIWKGPNGDGVFVKGMTNFLVTDDLHVMPASTMATQHVFEKLAIKDWGSLEETVIDLDVDKLHDLFKRSLLSKHPLSGMCFQEPSIVGSVEFRSIFRTLPKFEEDLTRESKRLKAKFLVCKSSNKVVYAEAGGDGFVDLLLSFLTFPLGSIVKLLDKFSSIGCIDNLYKSMENLSVDNSCFKSKDWEETLLDPEVAAYFGCGNSLLPCIDQPVGNICWSNNIMISGCGICSGLGNCFRNEIGPSGTEFCKHRVKHVSVDELNPKLRACKEFGGGYARKEVKFMITNELEVTPFSSLSSIQTVKTQNATFSSLEEKEIEIGEYEALNLLKACLTSPNPLSDVFLPSKQKGKRVR